ncbi:Collagen alpha-1(XXII) chain-like protein [Aix galericulata]|nr:Collagen alpha-1(XXII) chain-like protein [Aix galericulata]
MQHFSHPCSITNTSLAPACKKGIPLLQDGVQKQGCKNVHYDLVFILDASSSVGKEDFEKVRQWVANLVETFEIGPDKTRVGVVRYSDRPTTEFDLGKYKTREEIKEAARKIKYYGGNTNTGDALRYINTYSFSKEAGGRLSDRTVKKVAILLTDGRSQDYVLYPATAARQAGIRIFAVGVGEALKEELDEIASEPKSAHVFHVSDYNAIDKIRGKLRRRLCENVLCPNVRVEGDRFKHTNGDTDEIPGRGLDSTRDVFPQGLPDEYAFVTTFKFRKASRKEDWYIWQIIDKYGIPQVSIRLDGENKAVEYNAVGLTKDAVRVVFRSARVSDLFDRSWHKIALSIQSTAVSLYIDCKLVQMLPIEDRENIDIQGKTVIGKRLYDSVPIDVTVLTEAPPVEVKPTVGSEQVAHLKTVNCSCSAGEKGERGPIGPEGPKGQKVISLRVCLAKEKAAVKGFLDSEEKKESQAESMAEEKKEKRVNQDSQEHLDCLGQQVQRVSKEKEEKREHEETRALLAAQALQVPVGPKEKRESLAHEDHKANLDFLDLQERLVQKASLESRVYQVKGDLQGPQALLDPLDHLEHQANKGKRVKKAFLEKLAPRVTQGAVAKLVNRVTQVPLAHQAYLEQVNLDQKGRKEIKEQVENLDYQGSQVNRVSQDLQDYRAQRGRKVLEEKLEPLERLECMEIPDYQERKEKKGKRVTQEKKEKWVYQGLLVNQGLLEIQVCLARVKMENGGKEVHQACQDLLGIRGRGELLASLDSQETEVCQESDWLDPLVPVVYLVSLDHRVLLARMVYLEIQGKEDLLENQMCALSALLAHQDYQAFQASKVIKVSEDHQVEMAKMGKWEMLVPEVLQAHLGWMVQRVLKETVVQLGMQEKKENRVTQGCLALQGLLELLVLLVKMVLQVHRAHQGIAGNDGKDGKPGSLGEPAQTQLEKPQAITILSVTPKGMSGENFEQQRDGPESLVNMNMIVSHRENLENQGSQARRVPEAYRVSKDREETRVPQVPGGNQVRQVLLGVRDHQGRMVILVPWGHRVLEDSEGSRARMDCLDLQESLAKQVTQEIQEKKALQEKRETLASKAKKALKEKRALQVNLGYLVIKVIQD